MITLTKAHGNRDRLLWDVLKLFHHCSSLSKDRGEDETKPVPDVKWMFESQGRDGCIVVSPSRSIPAKGTEEPEGDIVEGGLFQGDDGHSEPIPP